jgi:hypothetical protein
MISSRETSIECGRQFESEFYGEKSFHAMSFYKEKHKVVKVRILGRLDKVYFERSFSHDKHFSGALFSRQSVFVMSLSSGRKWLGKSSKSDSFFVDSFFLSLSNLLRILLLIM